MRAKVPASLPYHPTPASEPFPDSGTRLTEIRLDKMRDGIHLKVLRQPLATNRPESAWRWHKKKRLTQPLSWKFLLFQDDFRKKLLRISQGTPSFAPSRPVAPQLARVHLESSPTPEPQSPYWERRRLVGTVRPNAPAFAQTFTTQETRKPQR